ncbi:MAG TPA: TonB family protein [Candidatus Baltobacteraceae bacterium]|nr:TonB family protein [Candidatus Baltobacteraceae bacterium]
MTLQHCDRIEALAGAIALGEATEEERLAYRRHIAQCAPCLNTFGGEREIERVARTVADARESEVWEPQLKGVSTARASRRYRWWRFAAAGVTSLVLAGAAVHALVPQRTSVPHPAVARVMVADANVSRERPVIEQRTVAPQRPAAQPQRGLIVQHNIVQLAPAAAPLSAAPVIAANVTPAPIAEVTVHAPPRQNSVRHWSSNVPVWRRLRDTDTWRTVSTTTTTSLSQSAPQTVTHRAELLQVFSQRQIREAVPLGGETAISPHPAMIAYDEGAQGTSVFQVLIDERGVPTKCIITKGSGYSVLDVAVCKAAMQVRYSPKTVDGRAVPGVYNDAFTFRMTNNDLEGIPKQIQ